MGYRPSLERSAAKAWVWTKCAAKSEREMPLFSSAVQGSSNTTSAYPARLRHYTLCHADLFKSAKFIRLTDPWPSLPSPPLSKESRKPRLWRQQLSSCAMRIEFFSFSLIIYDACELSTLFPYITLHFASSIGAVTSSGVEKLATRKKSSSRLWGKTGFE
jgi:hypothetical protein